MQWLINREWGLYEKSQTEALLYGPSGGEVSASRRKFDIPMKTERSRLISILLYNVSPPPKKKPRQ